MTTYEITYSNYEWVRRHTIQAKSLNAAIRKAKFLIGLSGVRCNKTDYGSEAALYPVGRNTVLFVVEVYH